MRNVRRAIAAVALFLPACAAHATGAHPVARSEATGTASAAASPRAPVVVAFVVDQLSAWVLAERAAQLPSAGGFARLRREGTWVKALRLPYAVTDTAPGHAALHTGRVPAESGIWGNEIPEPSTGRRRTFLRDDSTKLVAADGVHDEAGSSPARLRVDTVADRLRAAHPEAFIVSLSLKDRASIVPAGRKPSVALWFETSEGAFVTSTAYASSIPSWATPISDRAAVVRARSAPWTPSDQGWLASHAGTADDAPGEGDLEGLGTTFPHRARSSAGFRASPASDTMILELALAAVAAQYDRTRPTLLLLSMSASDVIGHVFGPDSWEAWDHLYKLDAALGRFLDALEARVGNVAVILAADHGNSSMPEVVRAHRPKACDGAAPPPPDPYERPICEPASRIEPNELQAELQREVGAALGPQPLIEGVADPYLFLTAAGRSLDSTRRSALDSAILRVFARHPDKLVEVFDVRRLGRDCPSVLAKARGIPARALAGEDVLTLVCRSWTPDAGAGDYYMVPKRGAVFDGEIVPGKGASHGGPYLHDRTVPMLVRAQGLVEAGRVVDQPVDFTAYSETLAALLGLDARSPNAIISALRASLP